MYEPRTRPSLDIQLWYGPNNVRQAVTPPLRRSLFCWCSFLSCWTLCIFFLFLGLSRNAWVRSLHCLVLSSKLTHWFMLLRLEWCDSGCWECFLPLVVWMLMMAHHSSLLTVCWEGGSSKNEDMGLGALITFLTMGHPGRIWLYFEPSENQPEYHSYHLNPSLNMDQTKAARQ